MSDMFDNYEKAGLLRLLAAVEDPAAYWEERCSRAEDRLAAVEAWLGDLESSRARGDAWTRDMVRDGRAVLAEPTSNEPQGESKFDAPGPDPDGGVDLTDEEFAAFLKAAKG